MNRSLLLVLAALLAAAAGPALAQPERPDRPTARAAPSPSPLHATPAERYGQEGPASPTVLASGGAFRLRAVALGGGATEASSPSFGLRGTVSAEPVGGAGSSGFQLGAGFWYQVGAPVALPPVVVAAAPLNPPVVIGPGGGSFSFQLTITNTTSQPQSFQGWTDVLLPNGSPFGPALGPRPVTLGGGGTIGPLTFRQNVPGTAPSGTYTYRVRLGTFPDQVVSEATFPFEKSASGRIALASDGRPGGGRSAGSTGGRAASTPAADDAPAQRWAVEQVGGPPIARWSPEAAARQAEAGRAAGWATPTAASSAYGRPGAFALHPVQPNPAAGAAVIRYDLPEQAHVRLAVYDALGREVAVLVDGAQAAGRHAAALDGRGLAGGVYLVRLSAEGVRQTRRVTLVR
ncbi:MAG: T9SS type A sorting domain-containing protein [Rubricoccaceae bacterium]|nr:T9SS type A sorting domain-containing protein [Rubricoccaceae bacterium]